VSAGVFSGMNWQFLGIVNSFILSKERRRKGGTPEGIISIDH
jgi:hypothetical protein